MKVNLSSINKAETVNNDKVVNLTIPKDRLRTGIVMVKFSYDTDTDKCAVLSVE